MENNWSVTEPRPVRQSPVGTLGQTGNVLSLNYYQQHDVYRQELIIFPETSSMIYGLIRFGMVPLALVGWLFYQLFKKKKTLSEMQPEILTALVFIAIWIFIFYQFMT